MTDLTDRQREIIARADALAARFAARAAQHDADGTFPHENYAELHAAGYLRLAIPRRFGGDGGGVFDMVLAQEHLARGDGATAMPVAMLVQLLGRLNDEQLWPEPIAERICREIVAEGGLINSVVTESELGSISRGGVPMTTATPVEGGWRIDGHKRFASGGPALRFLVVGVTIPPHDGATNGETASAIVRAGSSGVKIVPTWAQALSLRASGNDDVSFEGAFVPEGWLIGRRVIGAAHTPGPIPGLNGWDLAVAALYLGIGQAARAAACDYANHRLPSGLAGKPIADLTHIQQWIGEMDITLRAARAVLHDAARAWDAHPERRAQLGAQIAAAKYLCTNGACAASEKALRVAGGFSLTRDLSIERHFRDARAGLFHPPQDDLALALVGRAALAPVAQA
jgi:alkylation response protein AidB-like acyl-CoA dehydrogenase